MARGRPPGEWERDEEGGGQLTSALAMAAVPVCLDELEGWREVGAGWDEVRVGRLAGEGRVRVVRLTREAHGRSRWRGLVE